MKKHPKKVINCFTFLTRSENNKIKDLWILDRDFAETKKQANGGFGQTEQTKILLLIRLNGFSLFAVPKKYWYWSDLTDKKLGVDQTEIATRIFPEH